MWDLAHREFMERDAFFSQRGEHRVSETAVRIMIFDRDDNAADGPARRYQCLAVNRLDAEEVDNAHCEAVDPQLIVCRESFGERHPAGYDQRAVSIALPQDLTSAECECLLRTIEDRSRRPREAKIPWAFAFDSQFNARQAEVASDG